MKQERFRLDVKRNFFTTKTVKQYSRLHEVIVLSLALKIFQTYLDKALSNVV